MPKHRVLLVNQYFHYSLTIHGKWNGPTDVFDPARHKISINVTPTAEFKALLGNLGVNVLGEKHSSSIIGRVVDLSTGYANDHIVPGEYILITGKHLRVAPEDDPDMGIFFVPASGPAFKVNHRLHENYPTRIQAQVPASLPFGAYVLRIVTKYTHHKQPLNTPRIIEYRNLLTVEASNTGAPDPYE
jgi:hypothetical protein